MGQNVVISQERGDLEMNEHDPTHKTDDDVASETWRATIARFLAQKLGRTPAEVRRPEWDDSKPYNHELEVKSEVEEKDYFYQECYWGGFSRSIILPVEVHIDCPVVVVAALF